MPVQERKGAGKAGKAGEGTHIVEQGLLGVLPKALVQRLLENPHPGRHQQGEGEGSNACKGSTALQHSSREAAATHQIWLLGGGKKPKPNHPDLIRKLITILGFD